MTHDKLIDDIRFHLDRALRFALNGSQAQKDTQHALNLLTLLIENLNKPAKKKDTIDG